MNETMNIYTAPNSKVRYTGKNGYDTKLADKYLEVGKEYEVHFLRVGRSSSEVFFEEFVGIGFNSVHFENVGEFETVKPEQYNTYVYYNG